MCFQVTTVEILRRTPLLHGISSGQTDKNLGDIVPKVKCKGKNLTLLMFVALDVLIIGHIATQQLKDIGLAGYRAKIL